MVESQRGQPFSEVSHLQYIDPVRRHHRRLGLLRGRREKWKRRHTNFISRLLEIQHDTQIIYLRGNHDDFLERILPLHFANIRIQRDYIYTSGSQRFYVLHGDIFDHVTSSMRWLARIGDIGYSLLMWFNRLYNRRRMKRGLPYYSVSQKIKQKVKASVSYISDFEQHLVRVANQKGCTGSDLRAHSPG